MDSSHTQSTSDGSQGQTEGQAVSFLGFSSQRSLRLTCNVCLSCGPDCLGAAFDPWPGFTEPKRNTDWMLLCARVCAKPHMYAPSQPSKKLPELGAIVPILRSLWFSGPHSYPRTRTEKLLQAVWCLDGGGKERNEWICGLSMATTAFNKRNSIVICFIHWDCHNISLQKKGVPLQQRQSEKSPLKNVGDEATALPKHRDIHVAFKCKRTKNTNKQKYTLALAFLLPTGHLKYFLVTSEPHNRRITIC